MNRLSIIFILAGLLFLFITLSSLGWAREWSPRCDRVSEAPQLGWHFYCDPAEVEEPLEKEQVIVAVPSAEPSTTATERLAQVRAELDEARALAVLEPSYENVENYMRMQSKTLTQASNFADTFKRVVWQNPDLSYEGEHPQSHKGKKASEDALDEAHQKTLEEVIQEYALIYVGSGRCAPCSVYGPDLRRFAEKVGFTVLAVSIDGTRLAGWEHAAQNNGHLERLGVKTKKVPLTMLYHQQRDQVTILGVGYLAEEEILRRIHGLVKQEIGDAF